MSEEKGALSILVDLLDKAGEVEDAAGGAVMEAAEVKADAEGVIGRGIYGYERIQRGRNAIKRLTNPDRKEKPGKVELALETWDVLFGDGTGNKETEE